MPDLSQFAIVYATALPLTLLVSYLCERWWGNRYRTALQLRQLARKDRQETEAIRDAWAECFESSAHELYGVRVRDHLARLKAERDEARKEAKEWETVAEHLARPYVRAML